jgi:hypothetical protein
MKFEKYIFWVEAACAVNVKVAENAEAVGVVVI